MVDTDALRTWARVSLFVSAAAGCGGEGGSENGGTRGTSSTGGSADASTSGLDTSGGVETTASGSTAEPDGSTGGSTDTGGSSSGDDGAGLVEARPYELIVPDDYDPGTPLPLVLTLHGYGATGPLQSVYFRFTQDAQTRGYLVATPNGLLDSGGSRFWNATDACCDFDGQGVDDVAYLDAVLDDVIANYSVALDQIYVVGHSNGGFMAHRLACEIGDRIAAIVSLAGATWSEPDACAADSPVHVLQIHGTDDDTIAYDGGSTGAASYPSAPQTVESWATKNGCRGGLENAGVLDLEASIDGEETTVAVYAGCPVGGDVQLWTIEGGAHIPTLADDWVDPLWAYLDAHPKP